MNTSPLNSINLKNTYIYFMCFLIIFSSGAILDQRYYNFSQVVLVSLTLPILFKTAINKKYLILLGLAIPVYLFINFVNYSESITSYIIFVVKISFLLIFISYCINMGHDLFKILNNIILGICIYSIFTYIFLDVLNVLPYYNEVVNDKPYKVFFGFHYHWQEVNWFSWRVARNNSIFWEPGVYQIYLNFSLFYQLFIKDRLNKWTLLLVAVSLFTTFSTTGTILALLLFLVRYMKYQPKSMIAVFIKSLTGIVLLVGGVIIAWNIFNQKVNNGSNSYDLRYEDLFVGLDLFFEKPLFGWGFLNNSGYEEITGVPNNSNGLMSMFFQQGLMGIALHCLPIFLLAGRIAKVHSAWAGLMLGAFFFVSASTEPLMYANFFNLFICLGTICFLEKKSYLILWKKHLAKA